MDLILSFDEIAHLNDKTRGLVRDMFDRMSLLLIKSGRKWRWCWGKDVEESLLQKKL